MAVLDAETRRMVQIAVAEAPALTTGQITTLRRIVKPEQLIATQAAQHAATQPARWAA
ncbi:hypothetical protein GCM10010109_68310 [Actinoplanes campanulatus]|nr:hypothetical protein GCM10010109_68310 [Actinoplanes campanulatus]